MTYAFMRDAIFSTLTSPYACRSAGADTRTGGGVDYWELNDPELAGALKTRWRNARATGDLLPYRSICRVVVALTSDPVIADKLAKQRAVWRHHDRKGTYKTDTAIPTLCRVLHAHLRKQGVCLTVDATVRIATAWETCIWCELVGMGTQAEAARRMLENAPRGVSLEKTPCLDD
jgi:hypothetical protein